MSLVVFSGYSMAAAISIAGICLCGFFFLRNRHRRGGVKEKRRIRWTRRTRETQENLERTHDTRRDEQKRNSNSIIPKLKPTHPAAAASSPKGELESRDRNRIGCVGPGGGGGMVGCVGSTLGRRGARGSSGGEPPMRCACRSGTVRAVHVRA